MKKLGFVVLFFLSLMFLAGCQETNGFTVEVLNVEGEVLLSENISYQGELKEDLIDLIDQKVDLDYTLSQWGVFIQGVGGHYPTEYGKSYNYYFALYVDDEMSSVGLDQITIEEGMVISFRETTVLSEMDIEIDAWIYEFLDKQFESYFKDGKFDQYLLAAALQLDQYGYDIEVLSTINLPTFELNSISNIIKSSVASYVKNDNKESIKSALASIQTTDVYSKANYLNAYDLLYGSEVSQTRNDMISSLIASEVAYMDADFAAMALSAISSVSDQTFVASYKQDMINYLKSEQSKEGINGWGGPNVSSTAVAVLGLLAVGEDPTSESYSKDGANLIQALMAFKGDLGFKRLVSDQADDLGFSTVQAFAALSIYKIYRDQHYLWNTPNINLWTFEVKS